MSLVSIKRKKAIFLIVLIILTMALLSQMDWFWKLLYPIKYEELIIINAEKYEIDPALIAAMIFVESKYISSARSHRGALGLMQIMPDTGTWIAEQIGYEEFKEDKLLNPTINIMFGCWYIANLEKEFNKQLIVVLAAYNAGRGNVKKWIENNNWDGKHTSINELPFDETKNYVKQVLAVYNKYKKIYNFE